MARARKAMALGAAAMGAAVQYFFDSSLGRTRRARAKDGVSAAFRRPARKLEDRMSKGAQRASDRAGGIAHELTTPDTPPPTDQALVDKIRSEVLGAQEWSAYTINVDAVDGTVTLRGQVDRPDQVAALEEAVSSVPGVRKVDNFVHEPGVEPENVREALDASEQDRGGGAP